MQEIDENHVLYLGRVIPKSDFRVFIYGHDGALKLVDSYEEYEIHMETGNWFPELKDVPEKKPRKKEG